MSPNRQTAFRLPDELLEALHAIKERDGIPLAEQVRRALTAWTESKGVEVKSARKRVSPRKRA